MTDNRVVMDKQTLDALYILPLYYAGKPTLPELAEAVSAAKRKLDLIIEREGDAGGARVEPKYLSMLIAELLRAQKFSRETFEREKKREAEATALLVNAPLL